MIVIFKAAEDRPHYCTTADDTLPVGSICRCDCGRFWLRKTVIGDYPFTPTSYWVPVRWYHRAARKRVRAWQERFSAKGYAPGIAAAASGPPQTLTNKTIVNPVQKSVFANLYDAIPGEEQKDES